MLEEDRSDSYDVVVIGGGAAGLAGALWLARYRRKVRVFDARNPRNAPTWAVHGYLGVEDPTPAELRRIGIEQAKHAGAEFEAAKVERVEGELDDFRVILSDDRLIRARRLLVCTGLRDVKPEIPGLEEFYGKSIWYCPDCDGPGVTDMNVGIIGWGRGIAAFAMWVLTWTDRLTVLTHGRPDEMPPEAHDALARFDIPVITDAIARLEGSVDSGCVERVVFENGREPLRVEAMFFHIATGPGSPIPATLGCDADEDGFLQVDKDHQTNVPGVYAAGDITPGSQLAIRAAAEGTRAAIGIHKSLLPPERHIGKAEDASAATDQDQEGKGDR